MKKVFLVIAGALLAVAILATPVFAHGPENALGKNPNLIGPSPWGFDLVLDNGVGHGYIVTYPVPKFDWLYNPEEFHGLKNVPVVTDPAQVLQMENKWIFMSHDTYLSLLIDIYGVPAQMAIFIASHFPDGVYNKWNSVGQ